MIKRPCTLDYNSAVGCHQDHCQVAQDAMDFEPKGHAKDALYLQRKGNRSSRPPSSYRAHELSRNRLRKQSPGVFSDDRLIIRGEKVPSRSVEGNVDAIRSSVIHFVHEILSPRLGILPFRCMRKPSLSTTGNLQRQRLMTRNKMLVRGFGGVIRNEESFYKFAVGDGENRNARRVAKDRDFCIRTPVVGLLFAARLFHAIHFHGKNISGGHGSYPKARLMQKINHSHQAKALLFDVIVVPSFNSGSDHRPRRAKVRYN
ncbi:unnamed protein product [Strongylus vulgaris]|uniref:Uncharacterized protein n=1 Tax=Strongylus vulgaris TaxID=40348 RepID=A0A3P7IYJ7_STRVU|nr:unnamed protein product [Strongylus vulgaris]